MNQRKITETLEGFSNLDILETSFDKKKKLSFRLRISSVIVTKSAVSFGFGHIY